MDNRKEYAMYSGRMWLLLVTILLALSLASFAAAETAASGTWGENLTWTLDSNGLLSISGEGNMEDF